MPEMTGWDLVSAVRARKTTNARGLPICIGLYSAVLSAFTREQLARAQVDFAITKLTDPEAILDAIERALAWSGSR
jgi:CheY-like chemotaxis protein